MTSLNARKKNTKQHGAGLVQHSFQDEMDSSKQEIPCFYEVKSAGPPQQVKGDTPLTDVEREVLKLYKAASEIDDPLHVWCTAEHRGVSYGDEIRASCLFSFKIRKDVSQERRTQILKMLFESMTSRVDEAFLDVEAQGHLRGLADQAGLGAQD